MSSQYATAVEKLNVKVALYSKSLRLHLHELTSAFANTFRVTLDLISTIKYQ